jgi:Ca-activated chloride channel homolog
MLKRLFVTTILACAAWAGTAVAQEAVPSFKSSVELVPISAMVRDARGRAMTTLQAADFEVRDKGVPRPIIDFEADDQAPVTIAILLDTSGSMRVGSKLAAAREVVRRFAADLRDGPDAVGLFTFDGGLHELQPFTHHPAAVSESFSDAAPFGITSLYDAVAATARRLEAQPAGRRAIVVVTDGVDTGSTLTPPEVSARASAIDAPVYIVATGSKAEQAGYVDRAAAPNSRSTSDARDLAVWTGGELLWAAGVGDAAARARQILGELRQQYLIAIEPASVEDWRPLEVRVRNHPHLVVRTRSGYFGRDSHSPR